jgi:hypothetical protein
MDEKEQAAAYIKLQDDVKQLILDTVTKALNDWDFKLRQAVIQSVVQTPELEHKIKLVIQNQMSK